MDHACQLHKSFVCPHLDCYVTFPSECRPPYFLLVGFMF